ncbi:MAG: DUF2085 domain-containing protein [Pyrinomonadaceae bacterium]
MFASPQNYIPQTVSNRRPLFVWLIAALGSLATVALIVGAPLALSSGHPFSALTIYGAFSYVCHQIPERSFFIGGHPFAVCSRCTGLYAGFAVATVAYPLVRSLRQTEAPARKWLFLAAAPLAIDFTVGYFGIWENTHSSRFATGALLGAVAVFYVLPGLVELSLRDWGQKDKTSSKTPATKTDPAAAFSTSASGVPSDYSAPHRRI